MNLLNWNQPHNHQELEHAVRKSNGSVKRTPGRNGPDGHCGETWGWSGLPVEADPIVQSRHVMAAGEAAVGLGGINSVQFPELGLIRVIPAPFLSDESGMGVAHRPSGGKANTHRHGGTED